MIVRDGAWRLFDYDFPSGRSTWVTEQGGQTIFRVDYPVAKLIEQNAQSRKAAQTGWQGDWHKIGSVPLNLLHDENIGLEKALQNGDDKHISKFLNDPDNRAWRCKEGRV